jgi:hypothetical protein
MSIINTLAVRWTPKDPGIFKIPPTERGGPFPKPETYHKSPRAVFPQKKKLITKKRGPISRNSGHDPHAKEMSMANTLALRWTLAEPRKFHFFWGGHTSEKGGLSHTPKQVRNSFVQFFSQKKYVKKKRRRGPIAKKKKDGSDPSVEKCNGAHRNDWKSHREQTTFCCRVQKCFSLISLL